MEKYKQISRVLWLILFANVFVAVLKIVVGTIINSISLVSDGYHSVADGTSNIVGLIGIHFAKKPADEDHPYGHKKFETLSGLFIGFMLLFITGRIIYSAIMWFINPQTPSISIPSLIALIATLGINIFVSIYEYKKGKKLKSDILISDSIHTRSDIFVSVGVLITLLCVKLGLPKIIDPIASIIVAGFILFASFEIFKHAIGVLVDKNKVDIKHIEEILFSFEEIKDVHNIRSRGRDDEIFIDLHLVLDPKMSIEKSHDLVHAIEDKLKEELNKNIELIAHIEPIE